jgi:hypothetical protein
MSSEARLSSEPANPSVADLASEWRAAWGTPKTGPIHVRQRIYPFLTEQQVVEETAEQHSYANLVHGVASRIVEASKSGDHRQVLEDSLLEIFSAKGEILLTSSHQLDLTKDVLDMTVSMLSAPADAQ